MYCTKYKNWGTVKNVQFMVQIIKIITGGGRLDFSLKHLTTFFKFSKKKKKESYSCFLLGEEGNIFSIKLLWQWYCKITSAWCVCGRLSLYLSALVYIIGEIWLACVVLCFALTCLWDACSEIISRSSKHKHKVGICELYN